jgi:protease stability complex PrcB-like protein
MARRLSALLLTAAILLTAAVSHAVTAKRVQTRTVAKGSGASSTLAERAAFVVKSTPRWRAVWRSLNAGVQPAPSVPPVDFGRRMLLVVIQGRKPSGGYSIRVSSVVDEGRRWRVGVQERAPGLTCIVPSVVTSPYHVVAVRRSTDPVRFVRRHRTVSCSRR